MAEKITAPRVKAMKGRGEKVVCVTAYDATFGAIVDEAGVDVILVGDSVGNVLLGYSSTVPVTLEQMVEHTRATRNGVKRALLISDLPFGTYQASVSQAVDSAVALAKAGAEAVKLEGDYVEAVAAIVRAGIPVMGHLGMTPQSVNRFGGHRVQGRGDGADKVIQDAKALEEAGAFGIVLELVPRDLARKVSDEINIPTIGIGAGEGCDGQVQVMHDLFGLSGIEFRHAKVYMPGRKLMVEAVKQYGSEVRSGAFPTEEHSF